MWYVFLSTFFSLPLIFSLVAARISHWFSNRRYKNFTFFFQQNRLLRFFFLSLTLALSLLSTFNVDIKI